MFESVVRSKRGSRRSIRSVVLLVAAGLHAVVLGAAVAQNYFAVPEIGEPPLLVEFLQAEPPPPPAVETADVPVQDSEPKSEAKREADNPEPEVLEPIAEPIAIASEIHLEQQPVVRFQPTEVHGQPGGVRGGVPGGIGTGPVPTRDEPLRDPEVPAHLIEKVQPHYPQLARQQGVQGTVALEAIIQEDGRVADIKVIQGVALGCTDAAIEAVHRWRYEPARQNGLPVASILYVEVQFVLE